MVSALLILSTVATAFAGPPDGRDPGPPPGVPGIPPTTHPITPITPIIPIIPIIPITPIIPIIPITPITPIIPSKDIEYRESEGPAFAGPFSYGPLPELFFVSLLCHQETTDFYHRVIA